MRLKRRPSLSGWQISGSGSLEPDHVKKKRKRAQQTGDSAPYSKKARTPGPVASSTPVEGKATKGPGRPRKAGSDARMTRSSAVRLTQSGNKF